MATGKRTEGYGMGGAKKTKRLTQKTTKYNFNGLSKEEKEAFQKWIARRRRAK